MNRIHELISSLSEDGIEVLEMRHAFRLNGVMDVYKFENVVFRKDLNEYNRFKSKEEVARYVKDTIGGIERQKNFKQVKNGMSIQEFRYEMYKTKDSSHAEDFHWRIDEQVSEDHMYFIFHRDTVKIGRSKDVKKRLASLKTALSHDLEAYLFKNKGHMEKKLHHVFSKFKTKREWFRVDYRIKRFAVKYGELLN
jgi:hypothetical protein